MDNVTPKLAATFGVGFFGFIMAAYSYNKYHKPEYTEELLKTTNEDNYNEPVSENTKEKSSLNIKEDIKEDITEDGKEKITSHWTKYWKKEFTDFKNNEKEVKSNDAN